MSAASQVWNVLEIRLMVLQYFFATCKFTMHNPLQCNTCERRRTRQSHIAIFCVHRGVTLHAHPIFLAWGTFKLASCFPRHGPQFGVLSALTFNTVPWNFFGAIRHFEATSDQTFALVRSLAIWNQDGIEPTVRLTNSGSYSSICELHPF